MTAHNPDLIPRPEYPRPQFQRPRWMNLNGTWEFEFDPSDSGLARGLVDQPFSRTITVPFAPESDLSGIGDVDFHEAVWYRKRVTVPAAWAGERLLLHFQAVDYDTTVWVDGVEVGRHRGGFTTFTFDITAAAEGRETASVVVRARDSQQGVQARGKQATWYENSHAFYTRTTGIWQTVWLEPVPQSYLARPRITPDVTGSAFNVRPVVRHGVSGHRVEAVLSDADGEVARAVVQLGVDLQPELRLPVAMDRERLWCPTDPFLYDLVLLLIDDDGNIVDQLDSYAGLRSIAVLGDQVLLNGERVFQRLVLDQGYWPASLMTAPTDDHLVADIRLAMDAGFNGARIHEKVAEERYLHHADRLGYLVWGEFGDWGASGSGPEGDNQRPTASFVAEWAEAVERDFSHPSIVGWCPLNETYQLLTDRTTILDDVTRALFVATKQMDPTRPVIDSSGYSHRVPDTDVWDSHDYEQDPALFALHHSGLAQGRPFTNTLEDGRPYSVPYAGQPFMVSEFGGIWWSIVDTDGQNREQSWGYGERVQTLEEFYRRFAGLVRVLDADPRMFGYCYTQLTDVFQEQNGLYTFERQPKFDMHRIQAAQASTPAYEQVTDQIRAQHALD